MQYLIKDLISEISMGPFGSNIKRDNYVEIGVPYLNGSNVSGYKLNENSFNYVTDEKADSLKKAVAHRGDIIVTHRGTLGQIAYIPADSKYERYVTGNSQFRFTCNEKVLPQFLVYYFHSPLGQYKLLSNASQVGVPALARPTGTFQNLEVDIPDIIVQQKICSLLDALQTKIETNNQINRNLSEQLESVYASRFTIDLNGKLSDLCDYSKARIDVQRLTKETYYSTENMLPNKMGATAASSLPATEKTPMCAKGDVLISNIRPYFKKIVYCHETAGCSADVLCFTAKRNEISAYLFATLFVDKFFDYMVAGSKGTKMPRGDKQQIMQYPIHIPTQEEQIEFGEFADGILETIHTNNNENVRLQELRDSLLPKLMSGELDISDIEL